MEFETIIHATQFNEYFELNHTEHKVNRLHSDSSLLADIEIYPRPHQGFDIVYNTNAYDELTIQTLVSLIRSINMQLTHNPSKIIKDIELCNENDFKIYQNINHSTSSSHYQTVMERFEYQVEQYPNQIALQYEQQSMTYAELNHHVNRLAQYLRHTYHVQPNDIIALLAERSIEMVIGMLGILKAGAGYLPIDPDYPEDRTTFIIEDAQPKAIVTYQATIQSDIPQIELDTFDWNGDEAETDNPSHINTDEDTAYIIYTSGTTGKPKGTVVPHRGIDRLVHEPNYVELNNQTVILLSGTVAFDAATFEIYGALLNGGCLVLTSKDTLLNPVQLGQTIVNQQVNTMWLTSSLFNQIASERIEALEPLTYLLIGGEVLNAKWVNLLNSRQRHPQIINGYGPTENTTFTTTYAIPDEMPNRILLVNQLMEQRFT